MTAALCVLTAGFTALLLLIQRPLRKNGSAARCFLFFAVKLILASAAALSVLVLDTWASWHLGLLVTAVYAALFPAAWADLFCGLYGLIRKRAGGSRPLSYKGTVVLTVCLSALFLLYGTVNEKRSSVTTYTVTSNKLSQPYTVVFISDIHYGDPNEPDKLRADVALINAAEPDLVILGGDITDDFSTRPEMEKAYAILGEIHAPTYFIFGNHDRQAHAFLANGHKYTEAELTQTIEANGITVLRDTAVMIGNDFILIGREDESRADGRKALCDIGNTDHSAFLLIADHQPYDTEELAPFGADLQLSGHSHAGQLFPNSLFMELTGHNTYGRYAIDGTTLIVTAGEGVWHTPFRTDSHGEILIVKLVPAE